MRTKDTEKITLLDKKIKDYFYECDSHNEGKIRKPYTLSGLLYRIEMTKSEFQKLCSKPNFKKLLSAALAKIESFTEEHALIGELSATAAANSLKFNFGWCDTKHKEIDSDEKYPKSIKLILDGDLVQLAE